LNRELLFFPPSLPLSERGPFITDRHLFLFLKGNFSGVKCPLAEGREVAPLFPPFLFFPSGVRCWVDSCWMATTTLLPPPETDKRGHCLTSLRQMESVYFFFFFFSPPVGPALGLAARFFRVKTEDLLLANKMRRADGFPYSFPFLPSFAFVTSSVLLHCNTSLFQRDKALLAVQPFFRGRCRFASLPLSPFSFFSLPLKATRSNFLRLSPTGGRIPPTDTEIVHSHLFPLFLPPVVVQRHEKVVRFFSSSVSVGPPQVDASPSSSRRNFGDL